MTTEISEATELRRLRMLARHGVTDFERAEEDCLIDHGKMVEALTSHGGTVDERGVWSFPGVEHDAKDASHYRRVAATYRDPADPDSLAWLAVHALVRLHERERERIGTDTMPSHMELLARLVPDGSRYAVP